MDKTNKNSIKIFASQSGDEFKEMFDNSPIGVLFYDAEGKLTNANQSALEIAGIPSLSDCLGFNLFDNPDVASRKEELLNNKFIRFQASLNFDNIKKSGVYIPTKSGIVFIDYSVSVSVSGFIVQVQDITEQDEARINYEGLFNNKVMGLAHCKVIFNDNNEPVDFKFIDVNDTYEKYTGLKEKKLLEKLLLRLYLALTNP